MLQRTNSYICTLAALVAAAVWLLALPQHTEAAGARTAWVSSNHIQVIDLDTARVIGRLPLSEFIHDMDFSVDGNRVYVGSSKGLRVADANELRFVQQVSTSMTKAVAVSKDGSRVAAIHPGDREATQAARKAGLPLPPAKITIYSTLDMKEQSSWHVHAMTFDVLFAPSNDRVYVLVPPEGMVYVHDLSGAVLDTIQLVPRSPEGSHQGAMLTWMALSPDGRSLVVPGTTADRSFVAEVDLGNRRPLDERVVHQDLGHNRRIQGLAWDDDGSGVYVTAVNSMVKFNGLGLPIAWESMPLNYVDIEPIPGTNENVLVAPIFSKSNKSGGVAILGENGEFLRTVELPDMSPYFVAVRP